MNVSVVYNNEIYLDEIVQSVEWSGDVNAAYRTLSITLLNTRDGISPAETFELGKELRFYSEGAELFRGFIFRTEIDQSGLLTLTAYDENIYLVKNADSRKFTNTTASQLVRTLCTEFEVEIGEIADTEYVIPSLVLRDKTLWDMMITALTVTHRQTGRRFFIYAEGGRLNLVERKARVAAYAIESDTNLTTASYSQSIEDLRNQVRILGGDPDKIPIDVTVSDRDSIARYGLMQHFEDGDVDATPAQIKQLAEQRLVELNVINDEATISALGYDDTYAGVSVYVYEKMTGIIGSYYVSSDVHTYSNGYHSMVLTLSATDDLPTLEYTPPAESSKQATSSYVWESWF